MWSGVGTLTFCIYSSRDLSSASFLSYSLKNPVSTACNLSVASLRVSKLFIPNLRLNLALRALFFLNKIGPPGSLEILFGPLYDELL